jgi:hypothetical protein
MEDPIFRCPYFNKCELKQILVDRSCCFKLRPGCPQYIRRKEEEERLASELEEIASELKGMVIESSAASNLDDTYYELMDKLDWDYWDLTDLENQLLEACEEMERRRFPKVLPNKLEGIARRIRGR